MVKRFDANMEECSNGKYVLYKDYRELQYSRDCGNKLTNEKIIQIIKTAVKNYPFLRLGQSMYNILRKEYPDIANEISGTDKDSFYRDDQIPAFLQYLFDKVKDNGC